MKDFRPDMSHTNTASGVSDGASDVDVTSDATIDAGAQTTVESTTQPSMTATLPTKYPTLSANPLNAQQTAEVGKKLDAIRQSVMQDLGEKDALYIHRVYATVVYGELLGRGILMLSGALQHRHKRGKLSKSTIGFWLTGTSLLTFSKILNNMELGHNVMHGQYDWMQHKHLNSQQFDWDIVCPAPLWQHSHNYLHHTFTNVVGRDHDVGYHLIRITDEQPWVNSDRFNLVKTGVLALIFEWAVAFHDIQISMEEYRDDPNLATTMHQKSRALFAKIGRQIGKDAIAMPVLASLLGGKSGFVHSLMGNTFANGIRNVWTWAVIFCGHFTEQAHIYSKLDDNESRGDWYVRQMLGSSNLTGGKIFHIMTGNLSHQIEHHLFPDMPANRYASIAPRVKAVCQEYGLHYNTGSFAKQLTQVIKRIHHFSKPDVAEKTSIAQSVDKPSADSETLRDDYPHVSPRRRKWLNRMPDFLAQAVAYV